MSDMLAILLGAGGGKVSQALAALGAGKISAQGAQGSQLQGEGTDAFMAVLLGRMSAVEAELGLPVEGGAPAAVGTAGLPLKALDAALIDAATSPGDPNVQAALAAPMALVATSVLAAAGQKVAADAALPSAAGGKAAGLGGLADELVDVAKAKASKAPKADNSKVALAVDAGVAGSGKHPSAKGNEAAESAADGQLLPQARANPLSQARSDMTQTAMGVGAGSMMQALADQSPGKTMEASNGVASVLHPTGLGANHGLMPLDTQARPAVAVTHLSVDAPLKSPAFAQELGDRIVWLSSRNGQVADIALNPAHLGPLEVKLSLSGGEAGAQFFSPHPQVRDAIEAALPRLREMMADAGLNLGQAHVRDESLSRQGTGGQGENPQDLGLAQVEDSQDSLAVQGGLVSLQRGRGLVDLYA